MGKQYYISLNQGLAKCREDVCKSKRDFAQLDARCLTRKPASFLSLDSKTATLSNETMAVFVL